MVLTQREMYQKLDEYIQMCGSQKNAAGDIGVSCAYISDVMRGNRNIGAKVARYFGFEPITMYRQIKESE